LSCKFCNHAAVLQALIDGGAVLSKTKSDVALSAVHAKYSKSGVDEDTHAVMWCDANCKRKRCEAEEKSRKRAHFTMLRCTFHPTTTIHAHLFIGSNSCRKTKTQDSGGLVNT
jgi:hypothetical protein